MTTNLLRAGALSCALLASTALTAPALAQTAQQFRQPDANGVDVTHGDYLMNFVEGSIGSGDSELSLVRDGVWVAAYGVNGHQWDRVQFQQTPVSGGLRYTVVIGNRYENFTGTGTLPSGSSLTGSGNNYVYRQADGTAITFTDAGNGGWGSDSTFCTGDPGQGSCMLIPTEISRPNGTSAFLTWDVDAECWGEIDVDHLPCHYTPRLTKVSNSAGYEIRFSYASNTFGTSAWFQRTGAGFYNDAVSTSIAQASVSYSSPSTGVTQVTDIGGNVWRFTGSILGVTGIRRPGAGSDTTTIAYSSGSIVSSVTNEGVTTTYSRSVIGTTATETITDAASHVTTVVSNLATGRPTSITDPLSHTTSYTYDGNSRLTRVTRPEGDYTQYTYDGRGNITETRLVAKSGSGLSDIVATASYDSTCSNPVTCNEPNSVTDARGNTTDYTYDSTHGGVLTVTAPAPSGSGDRPQTRYSYTLASGVYRVTGVSACASGTAPSCVGTSAESRATIAYDANGNVTSTTQADGTGALSAASTMTYDALGNLLTVDGPLSGSADTTRYRYNAARQVVGVVGPDPDGGGALHHRAARTTYTNGLPTRVETGTVASQSDGDWAAFSSLEQVDTAYDANARPVTQALISGGATYALTQTSYDSLGRVQCVAQRMNPAIYSSLPGSACTLGTAGSFGDDRIARTSYDAAGRVTQVETGYGTGDAATEAAVTYSNNGRAATVTDANGNRTTYEYDGHDRLVKTRMPDPTTAGTSSTTDYEQLTLDAAGNVTSRRLRDGTSIGYTYDTLNRITAKDLPGSDPDVGYTYDLLGHMLTAATSSQTLTFTWDALGRNLTQANPISTVSYQYDAAGRRTQLAESSGYVVTYDYDTIGELSAIRDGFGNALTSFTYDDRGRRTQLGWFGGASTSYGYDSVDRLSSLTLDLAGTADDLTLGFGYNPAGQIVSTTRSNDAYAYTGHADQNVTDTVNGLNQVTATGATSVSYDSRGNTSAIGASSYGYDSENRLTSGPGSTSLTYDPLGRLYQVSGPSGTRRLVYDGNQPIAEYDGSNVKQADYVSGPGGEPLTWFTAAGFGGLHADERGSIIATTDTTGAATSIDSYDEYGNPASTNTGRFGYTGQAYVPELGLWYYRNRMYNPDTNAGAAGGRFMQTDPIGFGGGMNLYAYVLNDPVNFVDPGGLCPRGSHIDYRGATHIGTCVSDGPGSGAPNHNGGGNRDPSSGNGLVGGPLAGGTCGHDCISGADPRVGESIAHWGGYYGADGRWVTVDTDGGFFSWWWDAIRNASGLDWLAAIGISGSLGEEDHAPSSDAISTEVAAARLISPVERELAKSVIRANPGVNARLFSVWGRGEEGAIVAWNRGVGAPDGVSRDVLLSYRTLMQYQIQEERDVVVSQQRLDLINRWLGQ